MVSICRAATSDEKAYDRCSTKQGLTDFSLLHRQCYIHEGLGQAFDLLRVCRQIARDVRPPLLQRNVITFSSADALEAFVKRVGASQCKFITEIIAYCRGEETWTRALPARYVASLTGLQRVSVVVRVSQRDARLSDRGWFDEAGQDRYTQGLSVLKQCRLSSAKVMIQPYERRFPEMDILPPRVPDEQIEAWAGRIKNSILGE